MHAMPPPGITPRHQTRTDAMTQDSIYTAKCGQRLPLWSCVRGEVGTVAPLAGMTQDFVLTQREHRCVIITTLAVHSLYLLRQSKALSQHWSAGLPGDAL